MIPRPPMSAASRFLRTRVLGHLARFYINITCGLALISQEKDILHDVLKAFPQYAPLSPSAFAAAISGIIGLVLAVDSVFNTVGRVASPRCPITSSAAKPYIR
mgnify:CR=1 FL=1